MQRCSPLAIRLSQSTRALLLLSLQLATTYRCQGSDVIEILLLQELPYHRDSATYCADFALSTPDEAGAALSTCDSSEAVNRLALSCKRRCPMSGQVSFRYTASQAAASLEGCHERAHKKQYLCSGYRFFCVGHSRFVRACAYNMFGY